MKKYIIPIFFVFEFCNGQITIGKSNSTLSPTNASVSLELGDATGGAKGIVLPWVTSAAGVTPTPVPGTLIYDSFDKKIKYRNTTTSWFDLSAGAYAPPSTVGVADANTEQPVAKAIIGSVTTDPASGILVLSDTNKAMILPRVSSYESIVNPSPGMMVYVTTTNQLAVYNGLEWAFWTKP